MRLDVDQAVDALTAERDTEGARADRAQRCAVSLEQECTERAWRMAAARDIAAESLCTCRIGQDAPCPRCCVIEYLTLPDRLTLDVIEVCRREEADDERRALDAEAQEEPGYDLWDGDW